jgi:hypothetical protein
MKVHEYCIWARVSVPAGMYSYQYQVHICTLNYAYTHSLVFLKISYPIQIFISDTGTVPAPTQHLLSPNIISLVWSMLKKMVVGGPNRTFIYDEIKMHASGKRWMLHVKYFVLTCHNSQTNNKSIVELHVFCTHASSQ